jgi:hypothetical protein
MASLTDSQVMQRAAGDRQLKRWQPITGCERLLVAALRAQYTESEVLRRALQPFADLAELRLDALATYQGFLDRALEVIQKLDEIGE